jgi:hypothetical protein
MFTRVQCMHRFWNKVSSQDCLACCAHRSQASTTMALEELLLLARVNALVVYDFYYSSYSGVAASWAAHAAGGQSARSLPWLGVFKASGGCTYVPENSVDPVPPAKRWGEAHVSRS